MAQAGTHGSKVVRRLAAVAFADVAGFSRMMERDDANTIQRWKHLRQQLLEPKIREHSGQLLQLMGDGLLIEFQSVVDAVRWADDVQRAIAQTPTEEGEDALLLRVGINVEDVIVDGENIHGDGVNIAARIQQLASAGEVVMTAAVRDYVWNKLGVELTDLGERQLKNIRRPVRLYRLERVDARAPAGRLVQPHLSWNNRPSIAVMPFRNTGGFPADAYFGEGITEDIISALAVNRSLLVIARNSTLQYRDRLADMPQIAAELGVRYVLDGSVRRQNDALRIAVELNDAGHNRTIWAERYDGSVGDLFAFQDRIAASVVAAIEPRLYQVESARVRSKPTESLDAYDCVLRAMAFLNSDQEAEFLAAGELLDRAVALDPAYAQAYAYKAWWYVLLMGEWHGRADRNATDAAVVAAQQAMALDPADAFVIAVAAHVQAFLRQQPESAVEMFDRSLLANKNSAFAWGLSAVTCCYLGQPDAALERLRNSWRLNPFDPMAFFFWGVAGLAELLAERYDQALVWLLKAHRDHPGHFACTRNLCICHALMGQVDESRRLARDLLARDPGFRISEFAARYPLRRAADLERLVLGLRVAGLPE